ncbi:MAG: hypothetical protein ACTHM8_07965 [Sphingomonas sp.]
MPALALIASQPSLAAAPASHPQKHKRASTSHAKHSAKPEAVPATPDVPPSETASRVIAWVAAAHDNGRLPYIVIDKQAASLFLFRANGELVGQVPVLLGMGVGDDSSPGVGAKSLAEIGPAERTTPAGRFVAKFGRALGHHSVLWVDYANSVALHAVITTNKKEHRLARLRSPTVEDNRISFGCINVGTAFYTGKIRPLFKSKGGVVYILPDTKSLDDVFPRLRMLPYLTTDRMTAPDQASTHPRRPDRTKGNS